jgi:hypothetical protein
VSDKEAQTIARRRQLLELEAHLQRVTLAATLAEWQDRRSLVWLAGAGRLAVRALATPRIRWFLLAALMRRLRAKRKR